MPFGSPRRKLPSHLFVAATLITAGAAQGQDLPRLANGKPDFNGVWDHPRVADVTRNSKACAATGTGCSQQGTGELPFTEWGLAQWKDVEHRFDYSAHCLPWGYTRAWQVEYPVEFVQTPERLAILFESNNIFHVIFTDGRDFPKEFLSPSWMGYSIGKWDSDDFVVTTAGVNEEFWMDTFGHPHTSF